MAPAIVFGGLVRGFRSPIDLGEADNSQTGKGYRNKLTGALYSQSVRTVTQRKSGVGGIEESFAMALIRGANFISFDNIRGKMDSQDIESFMTEDVYSARVPYREPVEIDTRRTVVMMTSNKADMTTDLANRCSCVRIQKQPQGHSYRKYPEGDVLEHVRANPGKYLGAVFAVVRAWHSAGKPRSQETRHDFRPWAQVMDWISVNLLGAGPLLDGHRETQERMTSPVLNWLRDVAIQTARVRKDQWLRAGEILDVLSVTGVEIPGLAEGGDLSDGDTRKTVLQAMGRKLGMCFKSGESVTLDGMTVERREEYDAKLSKPVKEYRFLIPPMDAGGHQAGIGGKRADVAEPEQSKAAEAPENGVSAYEPAYEPPMDPPMKTHIPPNPPDVSGNIGRLGAFRAYDTANIISIEPSGGSGGLRREQEALPPLTLPPSLQADTRDLTELLERIGESALSGLGSQQVCQQRN